MEDDRRRLMQQTLAAKAEAEHLLASLLDCQRSGGDCEDLFKKVAGQSSLEKAIDETRRVVTSNERLLAQMEASIAAEGTGCDTAGMVLQPPARTYQAMAGR